MAKTTELSDLGATRTKGAVKKKSAKKSGKRSVVEAEEKELLKKAKKKKKTSKSDKPVKAKKKKKTSLEDVDIELPAKKKKKKSRNKELIAEKRDRKKDKLAASVPALEGTLETMIKENPQIREHDQFQEYVDIFNSLQKIARIKEEQCENNKAQSKDVYALMQIYNQMRDVIADIRALKDITQVADQINVDVLEPFASTTASILMEMYQSMEQLARKTLPNDQVMPFINQLKAYAQGAGASLQEAYVNSNNKTIEVLSEQ